MPRLAALLVSAMTVMSFPEAGEAIAGPARVTPAREDGAGFLVHDVESPLQSGGTQIRVLLPDRLEAATRYPVVYVLPVEAARGDRYGDGLAEVKRHDLHNKHRTIFVAPTFAHLPWYADHPSDKSIRQETYFLRIVLPFVEQTYPARAERSGRMLLGFSKSGWGAWSLLLRHPGTFARAAAWDAPLMMDRPGKYGTTQIFGNEEGFEPYRVSELLRKNAAAVRGGRRLILTGYGSFRRDHQAAHDLLNELQIPHRYRDGPQRAHTWHSGWVVEAVELLVQPDENSR